MSEKVVEPTRVELINEAEALTKSLGELTYVEEVSKSKRNWIVNRLYEINNKVAAIDEELKKTSASSSLPEEPLSPSQTDAPSSPLSLVPEPLAQPT